MFLWTVSDYWSLALYTINDKSTVGVVSIDSEQVVIYFKAQDKFNKKCCQWHFILLFTSTYIILKHSMKLKVIYTSSVCDNNI